MTEAPKNRSLEDLLAGSGATAEFKEAVRDFATGRGDERIQFNSGAPPIKVLRVIKKILETYPELPVERVRVKGMSGCSNFIGQAKVEPGELVIDFEWDCRWRAGELGWTDFYGDPDQIRAARQFDYQCFVRFAPVRAASQPAEKK